MKEIRLHKTTDKIIGALHCSIRVYEKVKKMSKENNVSMQDVVREILENVIDEVKII